MNRCSLHRRQSGIALILVTIGALALLGMAGLALDMGMAYIAKSRLQNAVDAAALDGAKVLNDTGSVSAATTAALATFSTNLGG
ncbi:MAG: TadE/TadG family type IV pilus assembly protein, partial [Gammaproteobacteria bacterium]